MVGRLFGVVQGRGRWLVWGLLDNVEDLRGLARFLSGGPGHVLIISRNPGWRGVAVPLGVAGFIRAESVAVLCFWLPQLTAVEADRVRWWWGDLPLVVEQAAALLADTAMTVEVYLGLLADRTEQVLAHSGGDGGMRCR